MDPVQALLLGLGIGLAAGVSPGPLLVLVITSSLRGGLRHGVAVAAAPVLSDLVIVGVVLAALGQVPERALALLGVVGGVVVVGVGVQTIREGRTASLAIDPTAPRTNPAASLGRGTLVNLLSPHPWISWIAVLGPLTIAHWRVEPMSAVVLVAGFYLTLVGSKVAVAALVSGGRRRLTDATYRRTMTGAGLLLVGFGVLMVVDFAAGVVA